MREIKEPCTKTTLYVLGDEGIVPRSSSHQAEVLVEGVYKENTHVVLMMKPMLGWNALNDPVLKYVGKQVFNNPQKHLIF